MALAISFGSNTYSKVAVIQEYVRKRKSLFNSSNYYRRAGNSSKQNLKRLEHPEASWKLISSIQFSLIILVRGMFWRWKGALQTYQSLAVTSSLVSAELLGCTALASTSVYVHS
ncbi:unnamed protein product [Heterobilharzia americana]|nr:unnamed protein product [Heterobilharzia americana]